MNNHEILLIIFVFSILLNFLFKKITFLCDRKIHSEHKNFIESKSKIPFSGGILLLITLLIFIPNHHQLIYKISLIIIFLIGFMSDINYLNSPNKRFVIQVIAVVIFVIISRNLVNSVRLEFFDILLKSYLFKMFFSSFCILILINGTNFMDGVNTLTIGYYLLISIFLINLILNLNDVSISISILYILAFSLFTLFVLNLLNLLYLGDNGAYLISFIFGIYLINLQSNINYISPYYIANLLWYPAYENFFSIIRKIKNSESPLKPDNKHLHQLLFIFLKRKLNMDLKILNSLTGIIINLFNCFIFFLATNHFWNTKYQISITFLSLIVYNLLYIVLLSYNSKKKLS